MSGTSMDGLDAAVAELEWDGGAVAMSPLRHIERPWPDEVRARLHASLGPTTAGELCELDQLIGQASAELAAELLPADLIVSHGQTVHHWVQDGEAKGTLQLGQPAWIVEATGLPVISDVRARDIAAGGHGAPLALRQPRRAGVRPTRRDHPGPNTQPPPRLWARTASLHWIASGASDV